VESGSRELPKINYGEDVQCFVCGNDIKFPWGSWRDGYLDEAERFEKSVAKLSDLYERAKQGKISCDKYFTSLQYRTAEIRRLRPTIAVSLSTFLNGRCSNCLLDVRVHGILEITEPKPVAPTYDELASLPIDDKAVLSTLRRKLGFRSEAQIEKYRTARGILEAESALRMAAAQLVEIDVTGEVPGSFVQQYEHFHGLLANEQRVLVEAADNLAKTREKRARQYIELVREVVLELNPQALTVERAR
jgi:hypothetical protein